MAVVFNSASKNILDAYISGKTFYLELVTAAPAATVTTNNSLTKASGGNYAPVVLTNMASSTHNTDGAKLDFDDAGWSGLYTTAATPIVGGVVCQRVGGSPATSDPVLVYLALNTSYTPGTSVGTAQDFTFTFNTNGVLVLDAQ